MPLNTQVIRNGESIDIPWGPFHVAAMCAAAFFENTDEFDEIVPNHDIDYPNEPQPITARDTFQMMNYATIGAAIPEGEYTLQKEHRFIDATDDEVFHLLPGDVLKAWRS